jgi:ribonuclease-3
MPLSVWEVFVNSILENFGFRPRKSQAKPLPGDGYLLGYQFRNTSLLKQALTHKSFTNENQHDEESHHHNEVLEFTGDAVLGLVVTELLIETFPSDVEGNLSKKRASLVNEKTLADLALHLKLDSRLRLGRGEQVSGVNLNPRILSSAFEAVIGAIFNESGYESARAVLKPLIVDQIQRHNWESDFACDYKSKLQEVAQKKFASVPQYKLQEEIGPEHNKRFEVQVKVNGRTVGLGWGKTKKSAEQEAARMGLDRI